MEESRMATPPGFNRRDKPGAADFSSSTFGEPPFEFSQRDVDGVSESLSVLKFGGVTLLRFHPGSSKGGCLKSLSSAGHATSKAR